MEMQNPWILGTFQPGYLIPAGCRECRRESGSWRCFPGLRAVQLLREVGQGWEESSSTWDEPSVGNSKWDKSLKILHLQLIPPLPPPVFWDVFCLIKQAEIHGWYQTPDGDPENGTAGILSEQLGHFLEEEIPTNWKKEKNLLFGGIGMRRERDEIEMRFKGLKAGRHKQSSQIPVFPGHFWCLQLDFLLCSLWRSSWNWHQESFSFTKGSFRSGEL